jgi:hypothetical protein
VQDFFIQVAEGKADIGDIPKAQAPVEPKTSPEPNKAQKRAKTKRANVSLAAD